MHVATCNTFAYLKESCCHQNALQLILIDVDHDLGAVDGPLEGIHAFLQGVQAMQIVCCSDHHTIGGHLFPFQEEIFLNPSTMEHFSTVDGQKHFPDYIVYIFYSTTSIFLENVTPFTLNNIESPRPTDMLCAKLYTGIYICMYI